MQIYTPFDLVKNNEYVLVDNTNTVIVARFNNIKNDYAEFFSDNGVRYMVWIRISTEFELLDATPLIAQLSQVYCVFEEEDYINDRVKFEYSRIMRISMASLLDKVFACVKQENDTIVFENKSMIVTMQHQQECCENVWLESVTGDLSDLQNCKILQAEEKHGTTNGQEWYFYTIATRKGYVDLRFCAEQPTMYSTQITLVLEFKK